MKNDKLLLYHTLLFFNIITHKNYDFILKILIVKNLATLLIKFWIVMLNKLLHVYSHTNIINNIMSVTLLSHKQYLKL